MQEKKREIRITEQETEVIKLIAKGYTDHEIAGELNVTYNRIRGICTTLQIKTGTVNRPHLIFWASKEGLLDKA